ncbi:hypothetical protein [Coleofasciculus sp.]|uniref:hypothetical protein n=1 Tax=Coleofasciculus sp. TaxID=3100458 RepID=UPI003A4661F4
MPQLGAMCEQDKIKFDTPGKEEFLGIVVNRWLEFPWLKPNIDIYFAADKPR